MAPKCRLTLSQNRFHSEASSSSDPTPSSIQLCDKDARKDFLENFSWRGVHSERRVILADFSYTNLPNVIHSRGWESLCDVLVICPSMLIQEFYSNLHGIDTSVPLFHTRIWGTRIVVTPQLVTDVFRVLRVKHLDYPGCEHLRTMCKDEMISTFYKRPSDWGDRQFKPCKAFAKGPRFINMVMNFFFFCTHSLTITLSQSLVLDFCFLFLSISL